MSNRGLPTTEPKNKADRLIQARLAHVWATQGHTWNTAVREEFKKLSCNARVTIASRKPSCHAMVRGGRMTGARFMVLQTMYGPGKMMRNRAWRRFYDEHVWAREFNERGVLEVHDVPGSLHLFDARDGCGVGEMSVKRDRQETSGMVKIEKRDTKDADGDVKMSEVSIKREMSTRRSGRIQRLPTSMAAGSLSLYRAFKKRAESVKDEQDDADMKTKLEHIKTSMGIKRQGGEDDKMDVKHGGMNIKMEKKPQEMKAMMNPQGSVDIKMEAQDDDSDKTEMEQYDDNDVDTKVDMKPDDTDTKAETKHHDMDIKTEMTPNGMILDTESKHHDTKAETKHHDDDTDTTMDTKLTDKDTTETTPHETDTSTQLDADPIWSRLTGRRAGNMQARLSDYEAQDAERSAKMRAMAERIRGLEDKNEALVAQMAAMHAVQRRVQVVEAQMDVVYTLQRRVQMLAEYIAPRE